MKKTLLIVAVAATALASCKKEASPLASSGDEIHFTAVSSILTRAADVNLPTSGFYVTALKKDMDATSSENIHFEDVHYIKEGSLYTSATKNFWPTQFNLDFYAYSPATGASVTRTDFKTFVITANDSAASQVDFVYASTKDWGKNGGSNGSGSVLLNFRHAQSKVILMLKNTNPGVKFMVNNVSIGNLYNRGTFTFPRSQNTDGVNARTLEYSYWSQHRTGTNNANTAVFSQTPASSTAYSNTQAVQAGADLIMIPQTLVAATTYASDSENAAFNGAYIKVRYKMQSVASNAYIVGSVDSWQDAIWPLESIQWCPGHKYTYIVDLASGGYYATNHSGSSALDPLLAGAEVKLSNATVDTWTNVNSILVEGGV